MKSYGEPCVIEDRLCTECGECDCCELDSNKICDNCCQCIESTADYVGVEIEEILVNTEEIDSLKGEQSKRAFRIKR
ncbi:hypothetical protein Desdi_1849 [Desulfitobacterium dichloroeliminans LMG P-21439]|uniref:Uncharacterized protein n=1 Tax=Desulfitobacterium dichloroeliminans (strain LMG P-21439 / DCA1) TaxID=871963 RepID=L0F8L4_DESDL|nr:hypothetical protein [Desulfitobacterium dichloroeliminans]AGA69298.1 hypothetical protein Desdi_1849 [Desulfitobacterium dichloroeliminans LMG P-21439]